MKKRNSIMSYFMKIYLCIIFHIIVNVYYASGENIPCASRMADSGYVCVCNETYCDTIENPTPLKSGLFYHYITSKTSPGFTKSIGSFENSPSSYSVEPSSNDFFFWVNASVRFQTLSGVGGGFTDTTGYNVNHLSHKAKEKFIESYFGKTGIEYTFGRVPVAATDFSLRFYTYDDVPDDIYLNHFNLTTEDFSFKIPLIKMATNSSIRGIKLLSSPWTPPSWMKTNNASTMGYLLLKHHRTYVNYLLKFLEAYSKNGIDFWGITQANEPALGLLIHFPMPNLVLLPPQLKSLTKYHFGPMFKQSPFKNVKILTLDDERPFTTWWGKSFFRDKDTAQYLDGIALHWYFDSEQNAQLLDEYNRKYPDKFILYTESSVQYKDPGQSIQLGNWDSGMQYGQDILQAYNHWSIGFIDWNLALNENGGPTNGSMLLDAAIIINTTNGEFYKQPAFYVLGHFSKFIQPGSIRVQISTNNTKKLYSSSIELGKNKVQDSTTPSPTGPTPTGSSGPTPPGPTPTGSPGPAPTGSSGPTPPGPTPTGSPGPTPTRSSGPTPPGPTPTGSPGPAPTGSPPGPTPPGPAPTGSPGPTPPGPAPTGSPGPTPPGPAPTGSSGPTPPGPPGPSPTGHPAPPGPPARNYKVEAMATLNPDGSHTVIVHNPKSVPVNIILEDSDVGTFNKTISAYSINTFIYW